METVRREEFLKSCETEDSSSTSNNFYHKILNWKLIEYYQIFHMNNKKVKLHLELDSI